MNIKKLKLALALIIPLIVLLLPLEWIPIDEITIIEHRVIAIFFLAALFWILEPIPIYATSILIIVLELLTISDSSMTLFVSNSPNYGKIIPYREIMYTFASPIIMLFLGGFFLAIAAKKYYLDQNLARILLKPFGTNPKMIMLGIMFITAIFSMFMSNTATTAMMLSILVPIIAYFDPGDKGKIGFALAIPLAANIGGMGTPIGTPPNAIALKYLTGSDSISFSEWMAFGLPYVIILILISWVLLMAIFPMKTKELNLEIKGKFSKNPKAYIVYVTFLLTILLWLTDFLHGMNSYVVAMIPVAVFLSTRVLSKEDIKKISWDVLWLVSGGIALGLALDKSGLARHVVASIPFSNFAPIAIIMSIAFLSAIMANFMSNTATANLLLPIMAALGASVASLELVGGAKTLVLIVALASSMGMTLPISTPPNALAHATGVFETKDMARVGILVGLIGIFMIFGLIYILKMVNFL